MRIDFEWIKDKARYEFTNVAPTLCHAYVSAFLMYIHREGYQIVKSADEDQREARGPRQLKFNIK